MKENKIFLFRSSENELPEEPGHVWTLAAFANDDQMGLCLTKASIQNDPLDHYFIFSVSSLTFSKVPNLIQ